MSLNSNSHSRQLFFDDEPTDLILGDRPSNGPTSTNAFNDPEPVLDEIRQAMNAGSPVRALVLMAWLLRSEIPMSERGCLIFAEGFRRLVPDCPKPIIGDTVVEYQSVLEKIVVLAEQFDSSVIQSSAETLCYRMYEGCGEFAKARALIAVMRDRTDRSEETFNFAQLTNNYGYEYLLEGNYSKARPYFIETVKLFESLEIDNEVANAQANLLTCEFALSPAPDWEALLPTLTKAHHVLFDYENWRVRKTMLLFAKRAEAQGRILVAIAWARRAVTASRYEATQLQQDDENYLNSLRRKMSRQNRSDRLIKTGGNDQIQ